MLGDSDELSLWTDEVAAEFPGLVYGGGRPRTRDQSKKTAQSQKETDSDEDESDEEEDGTDDSFYLMRVVWPEMRTTTTFLPPPRVIVDDTAGSAPSILSADISAAVMEEYEHDITGILLKSVARAATKYLSYRGARDVFGEDNETLGEIAGLAANAAGFIMERADTRSWHVLPASVAFVRLTLPAGTHRVSLQLGRDNVVLADEGGSLRTAAMLANESSPLPVIDLGDVEVQPGSVQVVTYRKWR